MIRRRAPILRRLVRAEVEMVGQYPGLEVRPLRGLDPPPAGTRKYGPASSLLSACNYSPEASWAVEVTPREPA